MHDRPEGAALLAIARRVLLREILPGLGTDQRYNGLMIANAMAIAARELALDGAAGPRERALIAAAYGADPAAGPAPAAAESLDALNRRLAADLRARRFGPAAAAALAALFDHQIAARISLANPAHRNGAGGSPAQRPRQTKTPRTATLG